MQKIQILASFLIIISCANILALGQTGHRVTGEIAQKYLTPEAQKAVQELLGRQSLAEITTYVDEKRALKDNEFWAKTSVPYHWVTVPDGTQYEDVGPPKEGDAAYALKKYTAVLNDQKSSKEERALALKFIVHIIGDLHQPLHVGTGLDRGGNNLKVKFMGRNSNLHSVWDSGMMKQRNLSYTEWTDWLNKHITEEDIKNWSTTDHLVWIKESYDIRQSIYPKDTNLSYAYLEKHLPTLKMRIQQAGIRIAAYLNEQFSK